MLFIFDAYILHWFGLEKKPRIEWDYVAREFNSRFKFPGRPSASLRRKVKILQFFNSISSIDEVNAFLWLPQTCNRIIWMATVCLFGLTAFNIAIQSWYRYEYNATVLSLETSYRSWRYPLFGYTVCSNYTDEAAISAIVGKQWNVGKGNALYAYYVEFVRTIATTTYLSLHNYERYANDETLQNVDMLDMIRTVRRGYLDGLNRSEFSSIITEFGVCYTTGYFRNNLRNNPHFADDVMKSYRSAPKYAYSDVMELSISPYHLDIDANSTIVSKWLVEYRQDLHTSDGFVSVYSQ